MLRATRASLVVSLWDTPLTEQVPFLHYWKHVDGKTGANFSQAIPRSVNGSVESIQPRTQEIVKWFPYRDEYLVNNKPVPSFMDVLHQHYFPKMLNDDERVAYIAEKTGRKPIDVAAEMFRMRRLRLAICQSLRDKLKGKWFRQPIMGWTSTEKTYMDQTLKVAQVFSLDFFSNQNHDPYVCYSPTYNFAECVDLILNKQLRTTQQYLLVEVVMHNSLPKSRLPGVKGKAMAPLEDTEPCVFEALRLKLEVMANVIKQETYVSDHPWDSGHSYQGAIVQMYRGLEPGEVLFQVELVELDKARGKRFLDHYRENHVAPAGRGGLEVAQEY